MHGVKSCFWFPSNIIDSR